jgi:hypothetical protein
MRKARCKICRNPDLRSLIIKLHEDGFTYRQIIKFLRDKFNYNISLGLLSNHFSVCENIGVFELKFLPSEKLLSQNIIDEIVKDVVKETLGNLTPEEINRITEEACRIEQDLPSNPITTQYSLLDEVRQVFKNHPELLRKAESIYTKKLEDLKIPVPEFDNQN